jgi:hypothetical protein
MLRRSGDHPDREPFRQISIAISRNPAIAIWVSQPSNVEESAEQVLEAVGTAEA